MITASQRSDLAGRSVVRTKLMVLESKDVDDSFELVDGFLQGGDVRVEFVDTALSIVALIADCHQSGWVVRGVRITRSSYKGV